MSQDEAIPQEGSKNAKTDPPDVPELLAQVRALAPVSEPELPKDKSKHPGTGPAAGPRKGKRSVRWDYDPLILARLEVVNQMMMRGARDWQIAEALNYSTATARKDRQRVQKLWQRQTAESLEQRRNQSVAQYRHTQQMAWVQFDKTKNPKWLRLVLECEREIVKLEGTLNLPTQEVQLKTSGTIAVDSPDEWSEKSDEELETIAHNLLIASGYLIPGDTTIPEQPEQPELQDD